MSPLTRILALALSAVLALQVVNAQGPPDGKYLIALGSSTVSPPLVGANDQGAPTNPVVVGGSNNVWTIRKSDQGEYAILLEKNGPWLTQAEQNEVVVSSIPPPARWIVRKQQDNTYSIEVPSNIWPAKAWTLDKTQPGTKVTLGFSEFPKPGQLWSFIPVSDE
jgi:hypothetical protein